MKHYSYAEWQQYVKDEMGNSLREELEGHLYTCDQCLDIYLQAVTANETSLPTLPNETQFTDRVMEMVPVTNCNVSKVEITKRVPDTRLFHYLLAAAATLLLMFTGVFQTLASYTSAFEKPMIQEKKPKPSVTEGVINRTFAWMDSIEKKEAIKK
ncbi:hypothetical protein [Neobacillus cucumis]|uniref:hypothetical protein n=1 Tax=Neobacillus cucumis TaxID=1740721 RepID=UPI001965B197|nr:hypothetical protein [Neobacillus cucumis]MBM7654254.1 hypothetical protein [Neobacillus cucumis]